MALTFFFSVVLKIQPYFKQILVFNLPGSFLNYPESIVGFRICEMEIESFQNQARVQGYV